ncbi:MAG: sulfite exporter TauE/SafE family protein [Chloroflexi bacterium]|nr:sulfite exporter TauE/SafE family protein [Chloroflexota bacterium]
MSPDNLSLLVAFAAGVLSFASPCVLPLVPAYVGHLAGRTLDKEAGTRVQTLSHAMVFVLGFTAVFVALGASVGLVGYLFQDVMKSLAFRVVAGIVLIVMGLHMAGVLRIGLLYRDTRIQKRPSRRLGLLASFGIGVIFAAGWTPCIGPILGTILLYAGTQGTVTQGALLLTAYSLGLGVPFLVAGYALDAAIRVIRRLNRYAHAVELTSGGLMVAMGFLVMFNVMTWIAAFSARLGFTGI